MQTSPTRLKDPRHKTGTAVRAETGKSTYSLDGEGIFRNYCPTEIPKRCAEQIAGKMDEG
jgi:hypothetical protein